MSDAPFDPSDVTDDILRRAISSTGKNLRPKRKLKVPVEDIQKTAVTLVKEALAKTPKELSIKKNPPLKAVYEAFRQFEEAVGGRRQLLETLKYCPENSLGFRLMSRLTDDPDFLKYASGEEVVKFGLAEICRKKKVSLGSLVAAFKDSKTAQLAVEALIGVAEHVPNVTQQMAEDAQNRWTNCEVCKGRGRVNRIGDDGEWALDQDDKPLTQLCFACRGEGQIYVKHDFQNRRALLEFTGILPKTPLVNNNIDNRSVSLSGLPGDGTFEGVMKSLDALVRKPSDPTHEAIDAEIVNVQSENNQ